MAIRTETDCPACVNKPFMQRGYIILSDDKRYACCNKCDAMYAVDSNGKLIRDN